VVPPKPNFRAKPKIMAGTKREDAPDLDAMDEAELMAMERDAAEGAKRARRDDSRFRADAQTTFADDLESMAPISTAATTWPRKPVPKIDPASDAIAFQWIDIDMYDGPPLAKNPKAGEPVPGLVANGSSSTQQNAAIIRLYGVTEEGNSIMMHVHGFLPYFYAACPDHVDESRCGDVRMALDAALAQRDRDGAATRVVGVQLVTDKMSIYGYQFDQPIKLWKIYLSMPSYVPKLRSLLEGGVALPGTPSSLPL
jgi:hypothetical protein